MTACPTRRVQASAMEDAPIIPSACVMLRPAALSAALKPPCACNRVFTTSSGQVKTLLINPAPAPAIMDSEPASRVHPLLLSRSESRPAGARAGIR